MKKVAPPLVNDLNVLDQVIEERRNGTNYSFFSTNANLLREQWTNYIESQGLPSTIQHNSEPWFTKEKEKGTFSNLYNSKDGSHSQSIKQIREAKGQKICPYCGRPQTFPLDHFLPKVHYPQFAFLSKNLILCCPSCNLIKANSLPENGLFYPHPYFQELSEPIYHFSITGDLRHPVFSVSANDTLPIPLRERVDFLIQKLKLNERLSDDAIDLWEELVNETTDGLYETGEFLKTQLDFFIKRSVRSFHSHNETHARFYSAVLTHPPHLNYLISLIPVMSS